MEKGILKKGLTYIGFSFLLFGIFLVINQKFELTGRAILSSNGTASYSVGALISFIGLFLIAVGNRNSQTDYDGVIVMCRNWRGYPLKREIRDNKLELSVASKMCCNVAANMYLNGSASKIIVGSGQIERPDLPSEGSYMRDYILRKNPDISSKDILIQEKSLETYQEIDEDLKLAEKNRLKRLALVTIRTQLPRCREYLEEKGINVNCLSAEDEISKLGPRYRKVAQNYENSWVAKYEKLKEGAWRLLQKMGVNKNLAGTITKITRRKK